jgi:uncharacterized protein
MNLLIIADDELAVSRIPLCPAEILVSCGDLPDELLLQAAARCGCSEILAVKGNHDSNAAFPSPIHDLHCQAFQVHGVTFGGFCGAWKYKPRGHFLFEQGEVERLLTPFPAVDIFIAHNSPRLIHDRDDDVHTGFAAFNTYIGRVKPKLFLHGHQHINAETLVGTTRVIGSYGYRTLVVP